MNVGLNVFVAGCGPPKVSTFMKEKRLHKLLLPLFTQSNIKVFSMELVAVGLHRDQLDTNESEDTQVVRCAMKKERTLSVE